MDLNNYSAEEVRKKAQALKDLLGSQSNSYGGDREENRYRWFGFPSETHKVTLRILPIFLEGVYKTVFRHNGLPGERQSELCMKTHNMHCPICDVVQSYQGRIDDKLLRELRSSSKTYVNGLYVRATNDKGDPITLLDKSKEKKPYVTGVPYLVPLSPSLFEWIIDSISDPSRGDITHPITGRDIIVNRKVYNGAFEREFAWGSSPIATSEEEMQKILQGMYKPVDIWKLPDDTFLKKLKEAAALLDATLKQRIQDMSTGFGSQTVTHPKAPTPAQQLGNPAMSAPAAPVAPPQDIPHFPKHAASAPVSAPQPSAPVAAQPAVQAPPAGGVATPKGAPACFGDAGVFDRTKQQCMVCNYDFHCEKKIASAKA